MSSTARRGCPAASEACCGQQLAGGALARAASHGAPRATLGSTAGCQGPAASDRRAVLVRPRLSVVLHKNTSWAIALLPLWPHIPPPLPTPHLTPPHPTHPGYGTAFGGVAPMLAALNSSAPGVTVVNIDSGFGASMAAWRILKNAARIRQAAMGAASS